MDNISEAEKLIPKTQATIMAGICILVGTIDAHDPKLLHMMQSWIDLAGWINEEIGKATGEILTFEGDSRIYPTEDEEG